MDGMKGKWGKDRKADIKEIGSDCDGGEDVLKVEHF